MKMDSVLPISFIGRMINIDSGPVGVLIQWLKLILRGKKMIILILVLTIRYTAGPLTNIKGPASLHLIIFLHPSPGFNDHYVRI